MRQHRVFMTKDHLIYIVSCNKARDELWCGGKENNIIKTTNAIGFLFGGTANSFFRDKQGAWNSHASLTSPVAQVRQNFSNFGMVSASNCSSFGAIVERENSFVAGDGNDIQLGAITSKNEKKKPLMVMAPYPAPIEWAFTMKNDGTLSPINPVSLNTRSQDLPEKYYDAGLFDIYSNMHLAQEKSVGEHQYISLKIAPYKAIDIDTPEDLALAESLCQGLRGLPKRILP